MTPQQQHSPPWKIRGWQRKSRCSNRKRSGGRNAPGDPHHALGRECVTGPCRCAASTVKGRHDFFSARWFCFDFGARRRVRPQAFALTTAQIFMCHTWCLEGSMDGHLWTLLRGVNYRNQKVKTCPPSADPTCPGDTAIARAAFAATYDPVGSTCTARRTFETRFKMTPQSRCGGGVPWETVLLDTNAPSPRYYRYFRIREEDSPPSAQNSDQDTVDSPFLEETTRIQGPGGGGGGGGPSHLRPHRTETIWLAGFELYGDLIEFRDRPLGKAPHFHRI